MIITKDNISNNNKVDLNSTNADILHLYVTASGSGGKATAMTYIYFRVGTLEADYTFYLKSEGQNIEHTIHLNDIHKAEIKPPFWKNTEKWDTETKAGMSSANKCHDTLPLTYYTASVRENLNYGIYIVITSTVSAVSFDYIGSFILYKTAEELVSIKSNAFVEREINVGNYLSITPQGIQSTVSPTAKTESLSNSYVGTTSRETLGILHGEQTESAEGRGTTWMFSTDVDHPNLIYQARLTWSSAFLSQTHTYTIGVGPGNEYGNYKLLADGSIYLNVELDSSGFVHIVYLTSGSPLIDGFLAGECTIKYELKYIAKRQIPASHTGSYYLCKKETDLQKEWEIGTSFSITDSNNIEWTVKRESSGIYLTPPPSAYISEKYIPSFSEYILIEGVKSFLNINSPVQWTIQPAPSQAPQLCLVLISEDRVNKVRWYDQGTTIPEGSYMLALLRMAEE